MMKFYKNYLALSIAIFAFSFVSTNAQNISANYKNSDNIEQKMYKQLIKLPNYGVFDHIAFKVDGDTVFLYGKVINAVNRKDAERRVEKIEGVGNVVNEIEVLPLSSFDDSIRYRTLRTIASGGSLYRYFQGANPSIKIIVDRGNVTLEGLSDTRGDANLANILANQVSGVFSVTNNLQVERDSRKQ